MPLKWNPGWNGAALVAFTVCSSVIALIVRRKWKLAEIRRAEVTRLMRLAVAETERVEKEAAAALMYEVEKPVSVVAGGGIGVQNCAVCQIPTTIRCSRCKAVRYCSGNCQINHWRQGHKYECHPPLIHDHYKDRPNVPAMRGVKDNETPEVSSNGLELEGKGHAISDDIYVHQSVSNMVRPQAESSFFIDVTSETTASLSASIEGRSDFKGRTNIVVPRVSNTKQLISSLPTKDHSGSVSRGHSFLGNGSLKVEHESQKVDAFLPNGIVSSNITEQLNTSSSLSRHGQFGLSTKGYGRYNCKMFFPYDDFIRLYNSDKVEMRPCGLANIGNSCYANAVLQCLAFTRPLAAFVSEGLHAKTCPKKGWCFTCEFEAFLAKAKEGRSPLTPSGIISHIRDIGRNFSQGMEEDAHEFLRYSIDAMQSACLKEVGVNAVNELAEETTLIQLIFGGYLRSKIKCMRCHGKSEKRDRMMDLTIDIHGNIGTLEEALAQFTANEILEGENKYRCDRCKSFERAKKQLTILEAPNVLTIALKRYQSGKYGKLNKTVHFPEYLNLAPYMRGSDDNSPVYILYAVVVHKCHMNATFSGHYVCYVKNSQGKWFKADDSKVKQVDVQKVLSQDAYMLLYSRCSPRAPSFLRKELTKKVKGEHVQNPSTIPRPFHPGNKAGRNHDTVSSNFGPHDLFDERFRRPPKVDSCSDCSSLFSLSDDGSSWSTESTKDSTTSDEFGDQSFGESGYLSSPRRPSFGEPVCSPFLYSVSRYKNLREQSSRRSNTGWANSGEPEPESRAFFRRPGGDRGAQSFY